MQQKLTLTNKIPFQKLPNISGAVKDRQAFGSQSSFFKQLYLVPVPHTELQLEKSQVLQSALIRLVMKSKTPYSINPCHQHEPQAFGQE
jgi:hypothetical protein